MKIKSILLSLSVLFYLQLLQSVSAQEVYSEDFESITISAGAGKYSFGYDKNQDTAAGAYKQLDYGTWVRQTNATISANIDVDADGDLEIRPNDDTKDNAKAWATLIDPSAFASTGSGTYTFSVDYIGADEGVSRIYLYSASGFDGTGDNDLVLSASAGGLNGYMPLIETTGTTVVNEIFMHNIVDTTASGTYSVEFSYTAGDAIAISFGSYNTAIAYDNISITFQPDAPQVDTTYSEDFESITIEGGAGLYSFGYDKNQDTAAGAYKQLDYGTWVRQASATISANTDVDADGDLEIRPNDDTKNNAKMWATLIDPSAFASTGSGTYTFSVDVIGADPGNSRIYVYSASGYDNSGDNDLILDTAEGGFPNYVPLQGTGTTVINEIFVHEVQDTTASSTYTTNFTYTAGDAIAISFGSYNTAIAYDNISITFQPDAPQVDTTYSEDFESITIEGGAGLYSFGYDKNQDTAAGAYKQLDYGTWVRQASATISANTDVDADGDLEIRPNDDTKNNAKMWATLIDPSAFASTGSGTYTFSVDYIGADEGVSRIYLYSASGFDGTGDNDLVLSASAGGLNGYTPLIETTGTTVVNEIFMHNIEDTTASGTYSVEFSYTAGDAIAISFGSYNTAIAYDNITIRPYSGDDIDADGLETSVETGTGIFVDTTDTGTDPNNPDTDGDGLNDGDEVNTHGTNPNLSDTDGDGLSDSEEINTYTTNPLLADSNNDGLEDGFLVNNGFDPTIDFSALFTETVMNEIGYSSTPGVATVEDVRLNSVTISNLDTSNSRLQLKLERSSDQVNWSHDSNDTVNIDLPMDGGQQFYRITLPQD